MAEEENTVAEDNVTEEQTSSQNEDLNSASADNLRVLENIDVKLTKKVLGIVLVPFFSITFLLSILSIKHVHIIRYLLMSLILV